MLDRETEQTFSKSKSNLARFIYKGTHENLCRRNSRDAQCQDRGRMLVVRPVGRPRPPLRCLKHPRPRRELVSSACHRQPQILVLGRFLPSWRPLPSVERLILVTFSNPVASVFRHDPALRCWTHTLVQLSCSNLNAAAAWCCGAYLAVWLGRFRDFIRAHAGALKCRTRHWTWIRPSKIYSGMLI